MYNNQVLFGLLSRVFEYPKGMAVPTDSWKEDNTTYSNGKWAWDRLMGRVRSGEVDPIDGVYRLQPMWSPTGKLADLEKIPWEDIKMIGDTFFKK